MPLRQKVPDSTTDSTKICAAVRIGDSEYWCARSLRTPVSSAEPKIQNRQWNGIAKTETTRSTFVRISSDNKSAKPKLWAKSIFWPALEWLQGCVQPITVLKEFKIPELSKRVCYNNQRLSAFEALVHHCSQNFRHSESDSPT